MRKVAAYLILSRAFYILCWQMYDDVILLLLKDGIEWVS